MDQAVRLCQDEVVRSPQQDRHGPPRICHAQELDDLVRQPREDDVPDVLGGTELSGNRCAVRDRRAPERAAHELDVGPLGVRHHEYPHLRHEVQARLVVRVSRDALM